MAIRQKSLFLEDFLGYIHAHQMDVYSMNKNLVAITDNNGSESKEQLEVYVTDDNFFCFGFKKAKRLLDFPDVLRIPRCPDVNLLCKGGLLISKETIGESDFTPLRLLLFWKVAFTGTHFKQQRIDFHQWTCFSWGIPQEKDIIELDRWNIPGELEKENARISAIAQSIIEWLKQVK